MKVILPTVITEAMLTASNIPETTPAAWNSATAYTIGQQAMLNHRIYESVQAGTNKPPLANPEFWIDVGPTNRWAMFDRKVGTQSKRATPIIIKIKPGIATDLAFLNIDAEQIKVELVAAGVTVWSETKNLSSAEVILNWYDYFFAAFRARTDVTFSDIPPYATGEFTITISKPVNDVAVGALIAGQSMYLGDTQASPKLGINDYSLKEDDKFGDYTIVERSFSRRLSVNLILENTIVDEVFRVLAQYRATPMLWQADNGRFSSLIVYGFYKSFEIDLAHFTHSYCSLDIEGLT